MRLIAALLTIVCMSACGTAAPTQSEQAFVRYDDDWRQRQAALDAEAIMQGMAQARQRKEEMARSGSLAPEPAR